MVPQIFYSVCYDVTEPPKSVQDRHTFHPAVLHGHCRKRISGADYPGMVADPERSVRGTVVTGLSDDNIQRLDYFEGIEYERRQVKPKVLTKVGNAKGEGNEEGEEIASDTYIFLNHEDLSAEGGEWDFEEFCRDKMQKWTRAGYVFEGKSLCLASWTSVLTDIFRL